MVSRSDRFTGRRNSKVKEVWDITALGSHS